MSPSARTVVPAALLAALALPASAAAASTVNAGNGTVQVGVTDLGVLGAKPCDVNIGVRLNAQPATDFVCHGNDTFDGWGAADVTSGVTGYGKSPDVVPAVNVTPVSLAGGDAGSSVTAVDRVGATLRVTHHLAPSPGSPNVFVMTTTIKNLTGAPVDVRYRRVTDYDDGDTFREHVALGGSLPGSLTGGVVDLDTGLPVESLNPLVPGLASLSDLPGPLADLGPKDTGVRMDVNVGAIAPDACQSFRLFYGVAATRAGADAAVAAAGIPAWAIYTADADPTGVAHVMGYAPPDGAPVPCPDPAPAPTSSPPPATPAPPALSAKAVFAFPGAKRCVSRRAFRIRLRVPSGVTATSATVLVNGKRAKVVKGARLTAPIDLRGLPKGRFTVKVTLKTSDGRSVSDSRRYRTCAPKRR